MPNFPDNFEEIHDAIVALRLPPRAGISATGGDPVPPELADELCELVAAIYRSLAGLDDLAERLDAIDHEGPARQVRCLRIDVAYGIEYCEWGETALVTGAERVAAILDDTWRLPAPPSDRPGGI